MPAYLARRATLFLYHEEKVRCFEVLVPLWLEKAFAEEDPKVWAGFLKGCEERLKRLS